MAAATPPPPAPLATGARLRALTVGWGLVFLASPGIASAGGSALLGLAGLAFWAWTAARPGAGRRLPTLLVEWLPAGLCFGGMAWWTSYFFVPGTFWFGYGQAAYVVLAGVLLRRLGGRYPLPLAAALAWTCAETLRNEIPPPFGLGWLRMGHLLHDDLWLAGGARVVGVGGLGFVLAAAAGLLAVLVLRRRATRGEWLAGAGPAVLCALLGVAHGVPASVDGPRVLLVQPSFSQEQKTYADPTENFETSRRLSLEGLASAAAAGEPPVDLVAWGETMLGIPLATPAVADAMEDGTELPTWLRGVSAARMRQLRFVEEDWVGQRLFGLRRAFPGEHFPAGTSFVTGTESYDVVDGRIVRRNSIVLFRPDGTRAPIATKREQVPGAETILGLERFEWARELALEMVGYVPDFQAADETSVLDFEARDGRTFRFSATVCFDNAFEYPYLEPAAAGPLDFHLVVSNEAWYLESCELDQMAAFTHLVALETGRAFVRATNSGLTMVVGPDGRERERLVVDGRDRLVSGSLAATVPVPADSGRVTLYVRSARIWAWLQVLVPLALVVLAIRGDRPRNSGDRPE
jgi:apolipoprotein N-acyltransferase